MQATIHNEFLTLTVDTHGAEAVSLKNAAGEELLWQADPAVWKRHAPILFPWTGKLPGGTFEVDGKTYKGGQHGFARDMEHTLLKAEGDTIQLELRSDDAIRKSLVGTGDRSERIRTYNFPQGRITDHRIGYTVYTLEQFLEGDMGDLLDALAVADREAKLTESEDIL